MSNPDRLQREAQDHAEALIEDRGLFNALAWATYCANRTTDGFWSRVVQVIQAVLDAPEEDEDAESDPAADRGDWEFHRDHDQ
jgi:hypothetical protein